MFCITISKLHRDVKHSLIYTTHGPQVNDIFPNIISPIALSLFIRFRAYPSVTSIYLLYSQCSCDLVVLSPLPRYIDILELLSFFMSTQVVKTVVRISVIHWVGHSHCATIPSALNEVRLEIDLHSLLLHYFFRENLTHGEANSLSQLDSMISNSRSQHITVRDSQPTSLFVLKSVRKSN